MKNKVLIAITVAIIVGAMVMLFHSNRQPSIGEFDVAKYQWEIENFASEKNVGQVNDVNTAIEKAKELWNEKYGEINGSKFDPVRNNRIYVAFDEKNKCWKINGSLPDNTIGAVPHALIESNGTVLAIWMG